MIQLFFLSIETKSIGHIGASAPSKSSDYFDDGAALHMDKIASSIDR